MLALHMYGEIPCEVADARCSSHIWAYTHTCGIRKAPKSESSYTYMHTQKLSHTMKRVY